MRHSCCSLTLCKLMECRTQGFPVLHYLKLMSLESMMSFNHLILCHPFLLASVFPSIRVFSSVSALRIRWPKYWSFSFSISPCSEYSGLISFRIDKFDVLAVQGTLKSLLQHHNLNPSILRSQTSLWSNSHICTWLLEKTALTIWTFVGKAMSLLCNILSRFATDSLLVLPKAHLTSHSRMS